jgi:anti-sigma factor RsiW
MKTFEERYTAWIDGQLSGDELAAFEQELAAHPEATEDRLAAQKLGDLLRTHGVAPALSNADFFNLQLQQRIEAEMPRPRVEPARSGGGAFFWPISRLIWAGAACLGIAALLYRTTIPAPKAAEPSNYFAQVVEAWPSDPSISATTVYSPEDNVTVLWLDGLDYMPSEQLALK